MGQNNFEVLQYSAEKKLPPINYPEGLGGREVCKDTPLGRREYRRRVVLMWERQASLCAICGLYLRLDEATFDHQDGRGLGGGHRDDRIVVDGKPKNAAVHGLCNAAKASRREAYLIKPAVESDLHLEQMLEGD